MTVDALKFFQNFIKEMISIGGENLPKTISTKLGVKLGKIYNQRGIFGLENSLNHYYSVLKPNRLKIKKHDDYLEVDLKYLRKFCPLGGKYNPDMSELVQNSLCVPYTNAFLDEIDQDYKHEITINECILNSNGRCCNYRLDFKDKKE